MIVGKVIGGNPVTPKSYILQTEDGQEYPAVLVSEETVFTAETNDVREGKIFATGDGVKTGEKVIPAYHTIQGTRLITNGSEVDIPNPDPAIDYYDYTQLQTILCSFNSSMSNSVSAEKVSIGDNVYNVQSTEPLSTIEKNHDSKKIVFGLINNLGKSMIVRYFMYKEIQ